MKRINLPLGSLFVAPDLRLSSLGLSQGGFRPRSSPLRRFLIKGNSPRFSSKLKLFPSLFLWNFKPRNFLCIQDRNEDFLAIKLYFQHYSLNFNNFHRKIRNVFLFFLYKRSQEIVFVQYTRIEKNLRDYKNVFFNSTGKFKFIERNKFMTI